MNIRPLGTNQKATLAQSSRTGIENGFVGLRRFIKRKRWLALRNKYRWNTLEVLKDDTNPRTPSTINDRELIQYIAASAPLHCTDGWAFLGRALACHARGDSASALHLAYYAELRAAASILAAEGTGIFDQPSVTVDSTGHCLPIKGFGTHVIAWLALEHWADTKPSADLLADIISVQGIPCRDWLDNFQKSSVVNRRRIASRWLKTWGLDLRRFISDREARNEASYHPSRMNPTPHLHVLESSNFLCELWKLHEPSNESRFDNLDRYLLRRSLEETYRIVRGKLPTADPKGFETDITSMVTQINPGGWAAEEWIRFFTRKVEPKDPDLISMAMSVRRHESPYDHIRVICRAVVLLRVATGSCSRLFKSAKLFTPELEFWWKGVGQDFGLWSTGKRPDNITDLWADVAIAISQLDAWAKSNAASASYANWNIECAGGISVLGSCERIGLWGLGL